MFRVIPKAVAVFSSGAGLALLAAFLFGVSTPLAKLLLRDIDPWMLAGLLYLGSGLGLLMMKGVVRSLGSGATSEDRAAMSGDYGALGCAGIEPDNAARGMIVQSEHEAPVPITAHCEVPIERDALMPRFRSS